MSDPMLDLKLVTVYETGETHHPLGNSAAYMAAPRSEEEIVEILQYATMHRKKINIMGTGTKQGYGGLDETADFLLTLTNYKGILEHSPGDMTITVRSGTRLKEIKEHLDQYGQRVPVDPSWPTLSTIGGIIAANESGPKRMGYGAVRDFVIGMRIVYPDSRIIRTGGKVVKNVAGYDMNKLFVGSMGTLGVISEITMKLRPIPQYESLVALSFSENKLDDIHNFIIQLKDSMLEPMALELILPAVTEKLLGKKQKYGLLISFEDGKPSVDYQEQWVKEHSPVQCDVDFIHQENAKQLWGGILELCPNGSEQKSDAMIGLKMGSKNQEVSRILNYAECLAKQYSLEIMGHGGYGHGISRLFITKIYTHKKEIIAAYINQLRAFLEEKAGYLICTHMPLEFRREISVWGKPPNYFPLLKGIKQAIDPNGLLNATRYIGGL